MPEWFEITVRDEFVLVKEAAKLLGVFPNTIRSWEASGKLTEHRHPFNNYRIYKSDDRTRLLRRTVKPRA